jgi:uncharacterized membrane protein YfcA
VVSVLLASLVAGQIDSFWLTKIFGLVMAYFGYRFTFVPTAPQPSVDPSVGHYSI